MGPSSEFRQQHLPFGLGRAATLYPDDWRAKVQRWRAEDARARFIDETCDQYRDGGSEIRLVVPAKGPKNLILVVNGKPAGTFIETKDGAIRFEQVKG